MKLTCAVLISVAFLAVQLARAGPPGAPPTSQPATQPDYLSEMPPFDRVLEEMKLPDLRTSRAQQAEALLQLRSMIFNLAGPRSLTRDFTAQELRLADEYDHAYQAISDTFSSPFDQFAWLTVMQRYDTDPFRFMLLDKYFSPATAVLYKKVLASTGALRIESGFKVRPGAVNPLAGQGFFILKHPLDDALTRGGYKPPAGLTPRQAMEQARIKNAPELKIAVDALMADCVTSVTTDAASGDAEFPRLPPGTYYLVGGILAPRFAWNLKFELSAGEYQLITLGDDNAQPFK